MLKIVNNFPLYRIGMCNIETKPGIFRRKSSNVSSRSRLAPIQSSSCPTSPRQGLRKSSKSMEPAPSTSAAQPDIPTSGLQRSASTISSYRPRSSPAGLYSYTGMMNWFYIRYFVIIAQYFSLLVKIPKKYWFHFLKTIFSRQNNFLQPHNYFWKINVNIVLYLGSAPPSVHGSRVELSCFDKGSAIYLGCTAPKSQSTWSMSKSTTGGMATPPKNNTPPPLSPKILMKR